MTGRPLIVLKFGSSVLDGPRGFETAAAEVVSQIHRGRRVVAVVSAPAGTTDTLLRSAEELSERPPQALVSRLLATGEAASVALLAIALAQRGVDSHALGPESLGLRTAGPILDADPVDVDVARLTGLFAIHAVVVAPGFVGTDLAGEPTLLGRGGSDLTALFLAYWLGAEECRLVKDVDGIFPADPRKVPGTAPFERTSWDVALSVGGEVVQPKAVAFASALKMPFRVAAPGGRGTWVGAFDQLPALAGSTPSGRLPRPGRNP